MDTKTGWGLVVICLAAFVAITILSDRIFEHVPHSEDEVAYIFQAKVFAQNRLSAPTPPLAQAFWSPFVVDYGGQRFGKYPPGWPFLLSLGMDLNKPWLVNALLGTVTLALIGWLGRCFYGPGPGLAAAGLGLTTPAFLFLSSSFLSHPASLFWTTITLIAFFYATQNRPATFYGIRRQSLAAFGAGLALGATFLTRPFAALGIGLAIGLFGLVLILKGDLNRPVLLWMGFGGILISALLPLYWWAITGDPTFNAYLLVWPYDRPGFGPDIGPYGYGLEEAIFINSRLKLLTLATGLFGWPGWTNLLFFPLPFLARRANRWDWLLLATLVSIVVVHTFYWAFGGADGGFPRYYYDALPALLLLTVRGIQISIKYLTRLSLFKKKQTKLGWLPVGLVMIFIGYNLLYNLPPRLTAQKGKYEITAAPLRAVERANLSHPALIIVKNVESWRDFAVPFTANSPTLDGPVVYAIDWGKTYTQQIRTQFKERTCWELDEETLKPCEAIEGYR